MSKKIKVLTSALICLLLSLCFFACTPASLTLDTRSVTVTVGESVTVTAVSSEDVVWTTDNDEVVLVQGGVITALREGTAKVTATAGELSATVNVTVRAAKQYTVTIDGESQVVAKGDLLTKPADPVKAADAQYTYAFKGWYVAGTETEWDFTTPVEKPLVLESRFDKTVNEYGVTIGGETEMVAYGSLIEKPADPVRDESAQYTYTFDGWFIAGTDTEWNFKTDKVTGAVSLEPRFTETVKTYTVKVNGVTSFVKYGESVKAPAYVPEKAATATKIYTFDKWVIEGTNTEWDFDADTVTGDVSIVASFVETDRKFDVVFVVDGEEALRIEGKANGDKITAPADPVKEATASTEYEFKGWFIAGTTTAWDFAKALDGATVNGETITLVASFVGSVRNYTVTLMDGNEKQEISVAYGSVAKLPVPEKEDDKNVYIFNGWYDGEVKFNANVTAITENVTLTAKWTAQPKYYTVGFYTEAGALLSEVNVKNGATVGVPTSPAKNQTVSTVYTFDKWVKADGSEYDFASGVKADVKLFATYTESVRKYVVTLMNGEEEFGSVEIAYDTEFTYDDNAAIPEYDTVGMYFVAWGEQGATSAYTGKITGNKTLYAITDIDPVTYTVVFDVAGEKKTFENLSRNESVEYGEIVLPATSNVLATKNVFLGWALEGSTEVIYEKDDVIRCPQGGMNLVAIYEEVDIIYNIGITLKNDAYTIVDENGTAVTADALSVKYGQVFKFKVANNSAETYGTVTVKNGSATLAATDGVYSFTVINNHLISVEGLAVREYDIVGNIDVLARQSTVDWAKTVDSVDEVLIRFVKNGEEQYLEDAIDKHGNYSFENLRAGEYEIAFAYYNEITGEYRDISATATKTLNYQFDANGDGHEVWDMGNTKVGTLAHTSNDANYKLTDRGVYAPEVILGTTAECVEFAFDGFAPGNGDFAVTTDWMQDQPRQAAESALFGKENNGADDAGHPGRQENQPTFGFEFYDGKNSVTIALFAEGSLRIRYNGVNQNEQVNNDCSHLVCGTGGIFGCQEWGDCYRQANMILVRQGDWLHMYLTAGATHDYNITKVNNKRLVSIDLTNGKVYACEQMTGSSTGTPTGTGHFGKGQVPQIAEVFKNVTRVRAMWSVSQYSAVNIFGFNYTENADVIYSYTDTYEPVAEAYTGKVVFRDGAKGAKVRVVFTNEFGIDYTTSTDANGFYTLNLPKGTYQANFSGNALPVGVMVEVGDSKTLPDVTVDYGFGGVEFVNTLNNYPKNATSSKGVYAYSSAEGNGDLSDVVVEMNGMSKHIIWSQPIAPYSTFGFTMDPDDNFLCYDDGSAVDKDMYFRWMLGGRVDGRSVRMGITSSGAIVTTDATHGLTGHSDGNYFDNVEGRTLKKMWIAGDFRSIDFKFVREGAKVSMYIKMSDSDVWHYYGSNNKKLNATDYEYFGMYNSGREQSKQTNDKLFFTNWFYNEGTADSQMTVTTVANENATLTVNGTTVTAVANDGYVVTGFTVNGNKSSNATLGATASITFDNDRFANYSVGVTVVKADTLVTVSGATSIDFGETANEMGAQMANYYNANAGTVTFEDAKGNKYVATVADGKYSIAVPAGNYTVKGVNADNTWKAEFTTTVSGNTMIPVVLDMRAAGSYHAVRYGGAQVLENGHLATTLGGHSNSGFTGITFKPATQKLEFGFRLYGNFSGANYPFYGMFVSSGTSNFIQSYVGGNWDGAIVFEDGRPWADGPRKYPADCAGKWKPGPFLGRKGTTKTNCKGYYYGAAYTDLELKYLVDGYKFSLWVRGYNIFVNEKGEVTKRVFNDWTLCYQNEDVKALYGNDTSKMYDANANCYFGVTSRADFDSSGPNGVDYVYSPAKFSDMWFNITNK